MDRTLGANIQLKIIADANRYIKGLSLADYRYTDLAKRIAQKTSKHKGLKVAVKIDKRTAEKFSKAGAKVNEVIRETVAETARYARGEVYRRAYVAPDKYRRLGNIYNPRTLAERSYAFLLPKNESPKNVHISKVSFENNANSGWFGQVALFYEYGTARNPAHPMIRPAGELAQTYFNNGIKYRLHKIEASFKK